MILADHSDSKEEGVPLIKEYWYQTAQVDDVKSQTSAKPKVY